MPSFHIKEAGNYQCEEKQLRKEKSRNRGVFHSTARSEVTVSVSVLRRQVFSKQVLNLCFCIGGLYSS